MNVSVIIVNYNTCTLLYNCLSSIYAHTRGLDFEVIVVDNASVDNSKEFIRSHYSQIIWIDAGKNLGFGQANNLGVQYATGEYLLLLNSDTILLNNAVLFFFNYVKTHNNEKIGVLGSVLLDKNHDINKSYGQFPSPMSELVYIGHKIFHNHAHAKLLQSDLNVDYVIGADMFIKRSLYIDLGGFDPNFFMYYEETDLQYRIAKNGFIRRIIVGPQIIHLDGGSFDNPGLTFNRFVMSQRSYNYYLHKHYSGLKYFIHKITLLLVRLSLFFGMKWTWREKLQAYKIVLDR